MSSLPRMPKALFTECVADATLHAEATLSVLLMRSSRGETLTAAVRWVQLQGSSRMTSRDKKARKGTNLKRL